MNLFPTRTIEGGRNELPLVLEGKMLGLHKDEGKPDMSLIPPHAILAVARVMTDGAKKYAKDNYRNGIAHRKLFASIERHLNAWLRGESVDAESGHGPLTHAAADCLMLVQMQHDHPELDDRYTTKENEDASSVKDCNHGDVGIGTGDGWIPAIRYQPFIPSYGC